MGEQKKQKDGLEITQFISNHEISINIMKYMKTAMLKKKKKRIIEVIKISLLKVS